MGQTRLLLNENSFARCETLSMRDGRLNFDLVVDAMVRQEELPDPGDEPEDSLPERQDWRAATRIAGNSHGVPLQELALFDAGQRLLLGGRAEAEARLARWEQHRKDDGRRSEESSLLLVAYADQHPVGYMELAVTFLRHHKDVELFVRVEYLCINPRARNQGYGIDLSIAAGVFSADILLALYSSVRSGTRITSMICSELVSEGGEPVARQIQRSLARRVDRLNHERRRSSVNLQQPMLMAGY